MARIRLDFSQFHPLDHWPGTRRCRSLPGGTRRHLHLLWLFRRRGRFTRPIRRVLACPVGRHRWEVWYSSAGTIHPTCTDCYTKRLPSEHEIDQLRSQPMLDPNATFEIVEEDTDGH